jgi:transposase
MRPISRPTSKEPSHSQQSGPTLHVALELSQATWLVTSLSPGSEKMSKHATPGGDGTALLGPLGHPRSRAGPIAGEPVGIAVIQEAGLDRVGAGRG